MVIKSMLEQSLSGKRLLIREDFNVPIHNGKISDDTRLRAALPTLRAAIQANARVMILSHLGRPDEGQVDPALSLAPVVDALSSLLGQPVQFIRDINQPINIQPGAVALFENVRFLVGENANAPALAQKLASFADIFVMDAFATAHRAQASTVGVAEFAPIACAGPLLLQELSALAKALEKPARPLLAIVAGSKVSTKLKLLHSLLAKVDDLITGGGILNTFIAASGYSVGASLYEPDLIDDAKRIMVAAAEKGVKIILPTDVVVAKALSADAKAETKALSDIAADDKILDLGPATIQTMTARIQQAQTILWNGPVGVFEIPQFAAGTAAIAKAIAASPAFSLAGGGDTLAAIEKYHVAADISYVSTGGGAFLEFIEGDILPAVAVLQARAKDK